MSDKGSGSFLSPYQRHPRHSARGLALFLIITLAAAGLWVSPAVAAYIDIFNSSVLLAVPAAVDDFYAATEDTDLVIPAPGVLDNDSDSDADPMTAVLDDDAVHGTLLLNTDGSFNYAPDPNFNGADSFSYHANDGTGDSNIATVSINVQSVNDAPSGTDNTITIDEDSAYTFQVGDFGFADPNDEPTPDAFSAVKITAGPVNGVLDLLGSAVTAGDFVAVGDLPDLVFTPASNVNGIGAASFTFQVQDDGGTAFDGVDLDPTANTLTFDITPVNDPPVLNTISNKNILELDNLTFSATGSDPDLPPNTLTFTLSGAPAGTSIGLTTGIFNWTPTEAQGPGLYNFSVCISDGSLSDCKSIAVTVVEVNTAPVLGAIGDKSVDETVLLSFLATATDADVPVQTLTFSLGAGAPTGAAISAGGAFSWTPAETQGGATYPITVIVSDGTLTDSETMNVTVTDTNTPPVPATDFATISEDSSGITLLASNLLINDTDADIPEQTLSITGLGTGAPVGGTVSTNTHPNQGLRFVFVPTLNFFGQASFTYSLTDGITTVDGLVLITVTPVNDAPVADPQSVSTDEDTPLPIVLSGSDVEASPLTYNAPSTTAHGTLTGTVPNLTYTPALNYTGPDSFTFTVNDGALNSAPATININVIAANDAPAAVNNTYPANEDNLLTVAAPGVLGNDTDVDGPSLTAILVTTTPNGALTLNSNGSFTYLPNLNINGSDSFTYKANDGLLDSNVATVTINITAVNDAPVLDTIPAKNANEMALLTFTASATDIDSLPAALSYSLSGTVPAGAAIGAATGVFSWTPTEAQGPGSYTFNVCVSDGILSDCQVVDVSVNEVNLAPVGNDDIIEVLEDSAANIMNVLANDTDPDLPPNTLSWTGVSLNPSPKGVLSLGVNITYTPFANVNGSDGFTYSVFDGSLSEPAAVTINILSVNDKPTGIPNSKTINEDTTYTFAAGDFAFTDANDTPANGLLAVKISTLPALGALRLSNVAVTAGQVILAASLPSLTYTPAANGFGTAYTSFTFQVQDNGGTVNGGVDLDTVARLFTINVTAVDDPAQAVSDSYIINTSTTLPFTVSAPGVLANDVDGDGFSDVTIEVVTPPTGGLVMNNNGSFVYTPVVGQLVYNDSFTYRLHDQSPVMTSNLVTVSLTIDLVKPTQVATWVLPVSEGGYYTGTNETVELKVYLENKDGVARIEFWYWDHTASVPHWNFIAADATSVLDGGKYYYSTMMSVNVLPVATNIQLFARTYDAAGNYIDRDLTVDPDKFAWILVTHIGTVFMPLILK